MQTLVKQVVWRPFHETIIEAISRASSAELVALATLIKITKLPKGHDEIITAWNDRRKKMLWGDTDLGVPANLLEQKQAFVKKKDGNGEEKESVNLDDLQQEIKKLHLYQ